MCVYSVSGKYAFAMSSSVNFIFPRKKIHSTYASDACAVNKSRVSGARLSIMVLCSTYACVLRQSFLHFIFVHFRIIVLVFISFACNLYSSYTVLVLQYIISSSSSSRECMAFPFVLVFVLIHKNNWLQKCSYCYADNDDPSHLVLSYAVVVKSLQPKCWVHHTPSYQFLSTSPKMLPVSQSTRNYINTDKVLHPP